MSNTKFRFGKVEEKWVVGCVPSTTGSG